MKKSITLTIGLLFISFFSIVASEENKNIYYGNEYGKSYIFVVDNVEFSVFPDGQFDFTYVGNYNNTNVTVSSPNVNISYNAGYNYEMFVQYDNYGGVIQIEEVPIYYDEFGRIAQAGDVEIRYSDRRIVRVGGLYVHYNYYGYYSHCTGYINPFNYYYVYRPWHIYYARPVYASCIVYDYPYRRYYAPIRYSYYDHHNYYSNRGRNNISYTNGRRSFHKPGSRVHYKGGRSVANRDYKPNRRNTAISQTSRRNESVSKRNNTSATKRSEKGNITNNSNSTSRRVASSYKGNRGNTSSRATTKKVTYKRDVSNNNRYSSSSKANNTVNKKENTYTKPRSNKAVSTTSRNKSNRSYSNKGNSTKRVASNSQRKSSSKSTTNSRGTSSKRGRGL